MIMLHCESHIYRTDLNKTLVLNHSFAKLIRTTGDCCIRGSFCNSTQYMHTLHVITTLHEYAITLLTLQCTYVNYGVSKLQKLMHAHVTNSNNMYFKHLFHSCYTQ